MILLDTNVISEMMKVSPSPQVIKWFRQQKVAHLYVTAVTLAEISYGVSVLPKGSRKHLMENAFNKTIQEGFNNRILSFDEPAAHCYGELMSHRKKLGRPLSILDGQIAAIALARGATVATRNIRDFAHCKVDLIDPFE